MYHIRHYTSRTVSQSEYIFVNRELNGGITPSESPENWVKPEEIRSNLFYLLVSIVGSI